MTIQEKQKNQTAAVEHFLVYLCFICNLSQLPFLFGNSAVRLVYMGSWLVLLGVLLLQKQILSLKYLLLPILFDVFCCLGQAVSMISGSGGRYIKSNLFMPVNLCAFVLLVGFYAGQYLNQDSLKKIALSYVVSSLIVAAFIYFSVFRGADWAGEGAYLYSSKNSAGQIFLTSILLLALLFIGKRKVLSTLALLFFAALIFMMKSRATIVSLMIVILYLIFFVIKKRSLKIVSLLFLAGFAVAVFANESLYTLFIEQIMLRNKEITDVSGILSERDLHYMQFQQMFPDHLFVGTGGTYLESFPLAGLLSYGLLGALPLLLFSLYPLYLCFKYRRYEDLRIYRIIIIALNIMMWFNGIFEEQSPFGPGVKCYFLWLATGLFLGLIEQKKENVQHEAASAVVYRPNL